MARQKNVIAPNDEKALVAMEKMAVDIKKARELYGDGQPFEEERVLDCIVFKADQSSKNLNAFGKYCHWLKAEVGHGRFMEGLKRRNVNYFAANWAMLIHEKLGPNFATWQNLESLGSHKMRAITYFSKEEIETYAKGGSLGNIPHDDVANMTVRELETEIRNLREKRKKEKVAQEDAIAEKEKKICELERKLRYLSPISEKEKVEKAIEEKLEKLRKELFINIQQARLFFGKALETITTATQIEGVTFPMLEKWAKEEYEELAGFNELFEQLDDALNYCNPDKGDGSRS
jgi:hypothetical protein